MQLNSGALPRDFPLLTGRTGMAWHGMNISRLYSCGPALYRGNYQASTGPYIQGLLNTKEQERRQSASEAPEAPSSCLFCLFVYLFIKPSSVPAYKWSLINSLY